LLGDQGKQFAQRRSQEERETRKGGPTTMNGSENNRSCPTGGTMAPEKSYKLERGGEKQKKKRGREKKEGALKEAFDEKSQRRQCWGAWKMVTLGGRVDGERKGTSKLPLKKKKMARKKGLRSFKLRSACFTYPCWRERESTNRGAILPPRKGNCC